MTTSDVGRQTIMDMPSNVRFSLFEGSHVKGCHALASYKAKTINVKDLFKKV